MGWSKCFAQWSRSQVAEANPRSWSVSKANLSLVRPVLRQMDISRISRSDGKFWTLPVRDRYRLSCRIQAQWLATNTWWVLPVSTAGSNVFITANKFCKKIEREIVFSTHAYLLKLLIHRLLKFLFSEIL